MHKPLAKIFNDMLNNNLMSPEWFTTGTTTLIPKTKETNLPNKYRPITCLTTTYKLFTGLISDAIYKHLDAEELLEKEQKGCIRRCLGTKDQLLINKMILEDCRRRQRKMSMAWVDYQKAFDSVPHSWIIKVLQLYKIHPKIVATIREQMKKWQTSLNLHHQKGTITIKDISIKRGIFQGDSLSPLIFCMALDPLSKLLNNNNMGYNLSQGRRKDPTKTINHLLFMDDLKVYTSSDDELKRVLEQVHDFSTDINMTFGLDKCAKCTIERGNKTASVNILLD